MYVFPRGWVGRSHRSLLGLTLAACLLAPRLALAWPGAVIQNEGSSVEVGPVFPKPESLQSAIDFWRAIFTEHDSTTVVLHDRERMDVIWEVLELPVDDSGRVREVEARRLVKDATANLERRLRRLARNPLAVDDEDAVLLALVGHDLARLEGAAGRVRSQRGVADNFRQGLERWRTWREDIHAILGDEGVPLEIAALPFVESMFNPKARSSAGAAGLWQLMPATARGLGLSVHGPDDERMELLKATRAAAKMLRQNYRMLGTWPLAITGYNHGPYGVRRAVEAVGSKDLVALIDGYKKDTWGFASKNFYAEFLAVLAILDDHVQPALDAVAITADGTQATRAD